MSPAEPQVGPQRLPVASLRPFDGNPRQIGRERFANLKRGLAADPAFLEVRPLIVNSYAGREGVVIGGNMRLRAAAELGWVDVPAIVVSVPPDVEKAWNLKDNNEWGEYDEQLLAEMLYGLKEAGGDVDTLGFEDRMVARLLASVGPTSEGEGIPEPPENPITQVGDLWMLGEHRLLCGDSTLPDDVSKLMDGATARLVWTDPPYGVDYIGKTADALTIRNDTGDGTDALLREAFAAIDQYLVDGAGIYVASPAGRQGVAFAVAFMGAGWLLHQTLVWIKNSLVIGHSDYQHQHELVLYGWKRGADRQWHGGRDQSTVFDDERKVEELGLDELQALERQRRADRNSDVIRENRPSRSSEHPTMKPVSLVRRMVENSSSRGDLVVDLFAGSGTTVVAAQQLGRKCYAMEIDPAYCDVVVTRWENLTGKQATRQGVEVPA